MSKLSTLKQQNPELNMGIIDALVLAFGKPKYAEMAFNIYKKKVLEGFKDLDGDDDRFGHRDTVRELVDMGFDKEKLMTQPPLQVYAMNELVTQMPYNTIRIINKFIKLNERGLIANKDVTSYSDIEQIQSQISIAEIKMVDKELEKFVIKMYEDSDWLIVKPLTYESSKKYGAGTRWCTAAEDNHYQFHSYSKRGILIYAMNKKTGYKVAAFKNLDKDHQRETSFWDAKDDRIDSMDVELPSNVLDEIIVDLRGCKQSNYALSSDEIKKLNDDFREGREVGEEIPTTTERLRNMLGLSTRNPSQTLPLDEFWSLTTSTVADEGLYSTTTTNNSNVHIHLTNGSGGTETEIRENDETE